MSSSTTVGFTSFSPSRLGKRSGHSLIASCNSRTYTLGGYDGKKCLNDFSIDFQPSTPAPFPARTSHSCVDVGEGMIVGFGSGPVFGQSNMNDLYYFCYRTERWILLLDKDELWDERDEDLLFFGGSRYSMRIMPTQRPCPRYGATMAFDRESNLCVVFGGTVGVNCLNDLYILKFKMDVENNTGFMAWVRLETCAFQGDPQNVPSPRYLSKAFLGADRKLILVGGGNPPHVTSKDVISFFELDCPTLTWKKIIFANDENTPRDRIAHSFCRIKSEDPDDDCFFLFGGCARTGIFPINPLLGNDIRAYPDAFLYDDAWLYSRKLKWARLALPAMYEAGPGKRDFHASAALRDGRDVFIMGGFDGSDRTNQVHRLRLYHLTPSLETMAATRIVDLILKDEIQVSILEDLPENPLFSELMSAEQQHVEYYAPAF